MTTKAPLDTFSLERQLYGQGCVAVAGIDEAGRGPLAGPVMAACVVLPLDCDYQAYRDSKLLSAPQRERLYAELRTSKALIGVGSADAREIEEINILQASLLAMRRALAECMRQGDKSGRQIDFLLIDGRSSIESDIAQWSLIKGESKSASIGAASIIAKVERDRLMQEAHQLYPLYGFDRHQGYPTKLHRQALRQHGPCPLHRRTFHGVREFFAENGW